MVKVSDTTERLACPTTMVIVALSQTVIDTTSAHILYPIVYVPDFVPAGTVTVPSALRVGVALPAAPVAGVVTVILTVEAVAVCVPILSLSNTVIVLLPPLAPLAMVTLSVLAFICAKVIVRVSLTALPKRSVAVKVTVTTPLWLHKLAGFTAL